VAAAADDTRGSMTSEPARPAPGPQPREGELTLARCGYLGAVVLGPVIPLTVYLARGRRSPFLRLHAATAANLSLTCLLYAVCCAILGGLLALDNVTVALVIALTLGSGLWVAMLTYLIRGAVAAGRGDAPRIPAWICARMLP
jgi:uncharacterized Tic20 family protein